MVDLWLVQPADTAPFRLFRLDRGTGEVRATVEIHNAIPDDSKILSVERNAVWIASGHRTLHRIDPATDTLVAEIDIGHHLDALSSSSTSVWVTSDRDHGRLVWIDPETNLATSTPFEAKYLACTEDGLWVTWMGRVSRVDPETRLVHESFELGEFVHEIISGHGSVYAIVQDAEATTLFRLGPTTPPHALARLSGHAASLTVGLDALWLAVFEPDDHAPRLTRVGLDGEVTRTSAGVVPCFVDAGLVWGLQPDSSSRASAVVSFDAALGTVSTLGHARGTCLGAAS